MKQRLRLGLRHWALLLAVAAALALNMGALLRLPLAQTARAQTPNRAAVVVNFGNGRIEERCVSFAEPSISGYELLRRSGLSLVANQNNGSLGAAICKIDAMGCDNSADCFCKYISERAYWSFWLLQNGAWAYSGMGVSSSDVSNGGIQGWAWGSGQTAPSGSIRSVDEICSATPATATSTSMPTPTVTASATASPVSADVVGGGVVISGAVATPVPTVAAVVAQPAPASQATPNVAVSVVAVVAAPVATATPQPPPTLAPAVPPTQPAPPPAAQPALPTVESSATATLVPATSTVTWTATPTAPPAATATATAEPIATPTASPMPTVPAEVLSPTSPKEPAVIVSASPTVNPTPTMTATPPTPQTPAGANPLGYALFGVIVLGLAGGIALSRVRR